MKDAHILEGGAIGRLLFEGQIDAVQAVDAFVEAAQRTIGRSLTRAELENAARLYFEQGAALAALAQAPGRIPAPEAPEAQDGGFAAPESASAGRTPGVADGRLLRPVASLDVDLGAAVMSIIVTEELGVWLMPVDSGLELRVTQDMGAGMTIRAQRVAAAPTIRPA